MEIGDVINGPNISWSIQSITDEGTYVDFGVSPATQDIDGINEFEFETVTATPITFVEDVDYWLTSPWPASGLYGEDVAYEDLDVNANAYGVDLLIQSALVSEEWDFVSA